MLVCVLHPGCVYSSLKVDTEVKKLGKQPLCLEGPLPAMASRLLPSEVRRVRDLLRALRLFPSSVFKVQPSSSLSDKSLLLVMCLVFE